MKKDNPAFLRFLQLPHRNGMLIAAHLFGHANKSGNAYQRQLYKHLIEAMLYEEEKLKTEPGSTSAPATATFLPPEVGNSLTE